MKIRLLVIVLASLVVSACGVSDQPKGRKASADFSRGLPVADGLSGSISFATNPANNETLFAWHSEQNDQFSLNLRFIDSDGGEKPPFSLFTTTSRIRNSRLIVEGDDLFRLLWLERAEGSSRWVLNGVQLDGAGTQIGTVVLLSSETSVGDYVVAQDAIVWEDRMSDGIFGRTLTTEPVLINESAESPALTFDPDNNAHLVWVDNEQLYYAEFDQANFEPVEGIWLNNLRIGQANRFASPTIGAGENWIYVAWSIFRQTGLEAGTGYTEYLAFPQDQSRVVAPQRISILPVERPDYQPYTSSFQINEFVPAIASFTSDYIYGPSGATVRGDEWAVAVEVRQQLQYDSQVQLAIALFDEGQYVGFLPANKTDNLSQATNLQSDSQGNLNLVWREGASGSNAYFATTHADIRASVDQISGSDITQASVTGGLEMLIGIMFFPVAIVWVAPGFIILGIRRLMRDDERMDNRLAFGLVIISLLAYEWVKILILWTIFIYVPFSAWLDIPPLPATILRYGYPFFALLLAIAVGEFFRRRNKYLSPILYFFIITLIDTILTLAVYGVAFLGVL